MDAIYMDGGSSLDYYTGMHWWTSERLMGMLLPKSGDPVYITPAFERSRALEQIHFGHDVRTWQENESPYALVARVMRERHAGTGALGIEEKVPFDRNCRSHAAGETGVGHAGHRGLPLDQESGGTCADADRQQRDTFGLQGGLARIEGRHDAAAGFGLGGCGICALGFAGRRQRQRWKVHRAAA